MLMFSYVLGFLNVANSKRRSIPLAEKAARFDIFAFLTNALMRVDVIMNYELWYIYVSQINRK